MDLNRASTFIRVVEAGGFTKAAAALGLPPSSVSRSVAKLEAELGVTLLERTTRKVALTDAGRAYFDRARTAIAGLEEASARAIDASTEASGLVRVALPVDLAPAIGAALAAFLAVNPKIRVDVVFTARGADLVGDVVDIAIALGRLADSSLLARRIGAATQQLFAAPAYLAARGTPKRIAQLAAHDLVVLRGAGPTTRWELDGPNGRELVEVEPRLAGDHLAFITEATITGAGIALLPAFGVREHVAAERLTLVLPRYHATSALHVLIAPDRHVPRRVALLREFLTALLGTECTRHGLA